MIVLTTLVALSRVGKIRVVGDILEPTGEE
jgi:hypothetical protein